MFKEDKEVQKFLKEETEWKNTKSLVGLPSIAEVQIYKQEAQTCP